LPGIWLGIWLGTMLIGLVGLVILDSRNIIKHVSMSIVHM
jgi:hypothetical protein